MPMAQLYLLIASWRDINAFEMWRDTKHVSNEMMLKRIVKKMEVLKNIEVRK